MGGSCSARRILRKAQSENVLGGQHLWDLVINGRVVECKGIG
jgi:hypothetical protein